MKRIYYDNSRIGASEQPATRGDFSLIEELESDDPLMRTYRYPCCGAPVGGR